MVIELKIATEEDAILWDSIVESSPHGTLFHKWNCLKIIEKYSRTKLYPLIVIKGSDLKGSEPIGCIPFFYKKKLLMKLLFCPPPDVGIARLGPVIAKYDELRQSKKEESLIEFRKKVDEFIFSEINPDYIHINSARLEDSRCFLWNGYEIKPVFNYNFCLNKGLEEIWSNIRKNSRQDIQRAKRRGLIVREGNKEDMLKIYELHIKRYAEQKRTENLQKEYLMEIYDMFHPQNLKVFVVELDGMVLSGSIEVFLNNRIVTWFGNSKTVEHANDLLTWECISWAHNNGFKYYEIMGAAGHERLYSTHSKFNPNLTVTFSASKFSSMATKAFYNMVQKSALIKNFVKKF